MDLKGRNEKGRILGSSRRSTQSYILACSGGVGVGMTRGDLDSFGLPAERDLNVSGYQRGGGGVGGAKWGWWWWLGGGGRKGGHGRWS